MHTIKIAHKEVIMDVNVTKNGTELTVEVVGRLDSLTSADLEAELDDDYEGVELLIMDLGKLEYISSSGLRVLLGASQIMDEQGKMVVRNVTEPIKKVIDMVGFDSVLNIE